MLLNDRPEPTVVDRTGDATKPCLPGVVRLVSTPPALALRRGNKAGLVYRAKKIPTLKSSTDSNKLEGSEMEAFWSVV